MQPSILYCMYKQFVKTPPVPRVDLSGKNVLVVGASQGLGFEAAKHFATMNPAKLILACRSQGRGEAARDKIIRDTEFKNVELWLVDLNDFASVSAFAERYEKEGGRLDILVENAGIIPSAGQEQTKDGWEPTCQTNNLATSLLGLLLLPKLLETAEKYKTLPRLVIVASGVHYFTKLDDRVINSPNPFQVYGAPDYFNTESPSDRQKRYSDSKLLNVFFARALASRVAGKSIVVDSVDPGFCVSNLRGDYKGFMSIMNRLFEIIFARTTEEGSRQLVYASVARLPGQEEIDMNGSFVSFMDVWEPSDFVVKGRGPQIQEQLWKKLIEELEKVNPKVRQIVNQYLTQ